VNEEEHIYFIVGAGSWLRVATAAGLFVLPIFFEREI
jgi:hypothetical protein